MTIGDARFFAPSGPHPLAAVAEAAGGTAPEVDLLLTDVAPLQVAGPTEVSFLDNRRYASTLESTSAGVVIVHPDMLARVPSGTVPIVTTEPYAGWARVAALFHPAPSLRRAPAYTRRPSSRRARGSMPRRRSGHLPWSKPGWRSVRAVGSDLMPRSARAWYSAPIAASAQTRA